MMTPARTGKGKGNLEFDRRFPGVGRIRCSSGTRVLREFRARDAVLTKLFKTGQLEVLRAFRDGHLTIEQLVEQDLHGRGGETLELIEARRPLWATVDATLPLMGRTTGGRARYALSFRQLRAAGVLSEQSTVADLARVKWAALAATWSGGPADWNRLRAAVSRFCSLVMRDKFSPFRRAIVAAMPKAKEPEGRIPDVTPAQFLAVLEQLEAAGADDVRGAVMVMILTGMRVGEYLWLDESHLMPATRRVRIPTAEGNKTGGRTIAIAEEDWGWLVAAVPFARRPLPAVRVRTGQDRRYARIMAAWKRACAAEGLSDVWVHDIRHCMAQWADEAGVPLGSIAGVLGHKDPKTTLRYTRMAAAARATGAVGQVLRIAGGKSR